ncbi:hypothetical protein ACRALDRAFT_209724 [Sodiomyces alcalophilus JCM 7366]|uniref:uncharacterized protein n=1 Tax=Sodiomyces alcalophilus JCM 7366 TaxID=591952 RepID=UPI0039B68BCF
MDDAAVPMLSKSDARELSSYFVWVVVWEVLRGLGNRWTSKHKTGVRVVTGTYFLEGYLSDPGIDSQRHARYDSHIALAISWDGGYVVPQNTTASSRLSVSRRTQDIRSFVMPGVPPTNT